MLSGIALRRTFVAFLGGALALLGWLLLTPAAPVSAATQHVTNCTDSGVSGDGSLRGEIAASSPGDTIQFNLDCPGGTAITVGSTLALTKNLTIDGTGHTVVVDGACTFNGTVCTSGGVTVFTVNGAVTVGLSNLTIQHGNTGTNGGGIFNNGGILTLTNSTLTGNRASSFGGGIINIGTLTLTNSTLTGNTAGGFGGGIYNDDSALTLTNSTFANNSATNQGGGIFNTVNGTANVTNTIVAGNSATTGPDVAGTVTSGGHNLIGKKDGSTGFTGTGDQTGTVASPLNAVLGPLGSDGGTTQTIPLLAGSPAIGGVPHASCTVTTDQRGFSRPASGACAIGAFEPRQATYTVGSTSDSGAMDTFANCQSGTNTTCRLRDALAYASSRHDTITFNSTGRGQITLTNDPQHGTLTLAASVTISGPTSGAGVTVDGGCSFSGGQCQVGTGVTVFTVNGGVTASLSNLTIQHGNNTNGGGGIYNNGDTLTVTNCTITANSAAVANAVGGGIWNVPSSTLTVTNSTITNNSADFGGGIYNDSSGTLTVTSSTLSDNSSPFGNAGGAIYNSGTATITNSILANNVGVATNSQVSDGGGIYNHGTLTLTNSTITNNSASFGGGIFNDSNGTLTVTNSTLSGNSATTGNGGGILNGNTSTLTVTNSTLSGNSATAGKGGGIINGNTSTLTVTNSTLSGNTAATSGGGIGNSGTLTLTNSTLAANHVTSGAGGGIFMSAGTATLTNTIVASNTAGLGPDISGTVSSNGNNLFGTTGGATITGGGGDLVNSTPLLGTLSSNGGPTQTIPLNPGSPAIGAGNPMFCANTSGIAPVAGKDQRGYLRPTAMCSIGAFEAQPLIPNALPAPQSPGPHNGTAPSALPPTRPAGPPNGTAPNPLPVPRQ